MIHALILKINTRSPILVGFSWISNATNGRTGDFFYSIHVVLLYVIAGLEEASKLFTKVVRFPE